MPEGLDKAPAAGTAARPDDVSADRAAGACRIEREGAAAAAVARGAGCGAGGRGGKERAKDEKPLRILLSSGPKDHGPGEHDYPKFQERWARLLRHGGRREGVDVPGLPDERTVRRGRRRRLLLRQPGLVEGEGAATSTPSSHRGGGAVYIHYAVDGHDAPAELAERIGLVWRAGSKFRHGPLDLKFTKDPHPITAGFEKLALEDESYWNLLGDQKRVHVLATNAEEGKDQPLFWAREQGKGRVFVSIPGHFTWTFDDPLFRVLLLRGIAWSAGRPAERLTGLAAIGARVK